MKKTSLLFLLLTLVCSGIWAAVTKPTLSTDANEVWYYIQFAKGESVLSAQGDGELVRTAAPTGRAAQLWKFTGSQYRGYTITSKSGQTLYVDNTTKESMCYASSTPGTNVKMLLSATTNSTYPDWVELQPQANKDVSLNQWGGAGVGKNLGLWDKGDANNVLFLVPEAEMELPDAALALIPYPASLTVTAEGKLPLSGLTAITYPDEVTKVMLEDFTARLAQTSGHTLTVEATGAARKENAITLQAVEGLADEAYTLTVDAQGVLITATQGAGFFYAMQTLKQMLPAAFFGDEAVPGANWAIPYVTIADQPALGHRGYMLDIARHFFDKKEVKRILDLMSLYKMNRLHWHLTDDQGWRIEIPEYPLLTEVGSIRAGSFINAGGSSKFFDDTEYGRGMWYSLDDLREIVAYAKARHIEIIPEIDLPGHMVAAVTSYPEFSCDPTKQYSVRIDGGISHDVLNVGKDEVIDFLKCVLGHVAEVFPYKYIHLGGDECPTGQWQTNADCLARVQNEGLAGVHELQSWLVEELGIYLRDQYGKDLVVWDEVLAHWQADNTIKPVIMAWNSIGKSSDAADKGFKSIVVPYQTLYFDFMQVTVDQADVNEVYQGGWGDGFVNDLPEVYNFNPLGALGGREEYCLGVQGNMWTETCSSVEQLEYQLLPRLLALSETGWLPASAKNWNSFYVRLQSHDEVLDLLKFVYAKHYIEPADLTPLQAALEEATSILDASVRGAVGYPEASVYDNLLQARDAARTSTDATALTTLQEALTVYRSAPVVQPKEGGVYKIVSASTYYKKRYEGSALYEHDGGIRFHYTPQTEPEELWQFVPTESGYLLRNYATGHTVTLPAIDQMVQIGTEGGTVVRLDKATVPAKQYDYVPGALTISAVDGYSATATGSAKRLFGQPTGQAAVVDDPMLCHPGTWKLEEVTDYRAQLEGLCRKCERTLAESKPGEMGQPTEEAIQMLREEVLTPARAALEGTVSKETYDTYCALYAEFLAMPRTSMLGSIDETYYYRIRNAHFTTYYAKADASSRTVKPVALSASDDAFYWSIVKRADGTIYVYNKATGTAAYVSQNAVDQTVKLGDAKAGLSRWALVPVTTDTGTEGVALIAEGGENAWYTNPSAFNTVLLKPSSWGASAWILERTEKVVPTAIRAISAEEDADAPYYDLSGRRVSEPKRGVYIHGHRKVTIK